MHRKRSVSASERKSEAEEELTGEDDEEGVEGRLEAVVAGLGEDNVCSAEGGRQYVGGDAKNERKLRRTDDGAEDAKRETRDALERLVERLNRQGKGVDIGNVL